MSKSSSVYWSGAQISSGISFQANFFWYTVKSTVMKKAFFLVLLLISVTYLFGKKIEKPQAAAQEMKIQQLSFGTAPPKYGFRIGNYRNLKNGKRELDYEENEK
ncbi:uncharacterized protein LOC144646374 isoform X1 [Oculina patagonica]